MLRNERWFISYRYVEQDFLVPMVSETTYDSVVIDMTPAQWVRKHGSNYHILYAEKISPALASELVHGGAGVKVEYSGE